MYKKLLKPQLFLAVLVLTIFAVSCEENLVLDVPEEILDTEWSSGEVAVTPSDLASYSGTEADQDFLDEQFGDDSTSRSAEMDAAMDMMLSSIESLGFGTSSKSITGYATYGLSIADESFSPDEGYTVDINTATGVFSTTATWDGEIDNFISMESQEDLFKAIGATDSSLLFNLDFDVDLSTDDTVTEGLKSASWHHTSGISIENNDVEFTYDETEGTLDVSGTTTIQAYLMTSLGFTVSGSSEGNAKYIITVEMEDVDVETVSLAALNDELEESETSEDVYDIISKYFFDNSDTFLTITITAYNNSNVKIGSVEYNPFANFVS